MKFTIFPNGCAKGKAEIQESSAQIWFQEGRGEGGGISGNTYAIDDIFFQAAIIMFL